MQPAHAIVVALVLTALAGCAELEDFEVSAPAWESGYSWSYNVDTRVEGGGLGDVEGPHTTTLEVLRHTDVADGAPVYLVEEREGEWSSLLAVSAKDLSAHWVQDDLIYDCDGPPACVDDLSLDDEGWGLFPALRFPLEDGKKWSDTLEDFVRLDAVVQGSRSIETPAGTFDAIGVRFDAHVLDTEQDGGFEESFDVELSWDVFYSEEVRAVVASDLRAEGRITESDGDGVSMTHDIDIRVEHRLVAYSLEAKPQMTLDALWDHLDGDKYVHRYVRLLPTALPAAGAGDVSLEFQADGYGLGATDRLEWTLQDAAGDTIADGLGKYFFPEVPHGGIYKATVEAVRNGTVLATDSYAFALDLADSTTVSCGTVVAGVGDGCPAIEFEVKQGAVRVAVDAFSSGLYPGDGELVLTAPDGSEHNGRFLGSDDVGIWTAQYVLEDGVEVDVDLEWYVLYDAAPLRDA